MKRHTSTPSISILAGLLCAGVCLATAGCGDDGETDTTTTTSGDPPQHECLADDDCRDGDDCTIDDCTVGEAGVNVCAHPPDFAACPKECVTSDDCTDGDSCTVDTCEEPEDVTTFRVATCSNVFDPSLAGCSECTDDSDCDDGDPCTSDECSVGATSECVHDAIPSCGEGCTEATECTDGDECTIDVCEMREGDAAPTCYQDAIAGCGEACNGDGTCDFSTEDCDCADCADEAACGAGCTVFTILDFPTFDAFFEVLTSEIDDVGDDYFTGNSLDGIEPGTYDLAPHENFADCDATAPCIGVAADGFSHFFDAVSGQLVVDEVDPTTGSFSNVLLYPRTADANGDLTIDYEGECLYLEFVGIPTAR